VKEQSDYPAPVSDPEAEGLPGTADDDSVADEGSDSPRCADGPDPALLPHDRPLGLDRYGTTAAEARHGEPLSCKLAREEPDIQPEDVPVDRGLAAEEEVGDTGAPEPAGPAAAAERIGAPWTTDVAAVHEPPVPPNLDSQVSMYDRPGVDAHVGRLVAPDEGAHPVDGPTAVARDAGTAGGGASAEELAMHAEPQG